MQSGIVPVMGSEWRTGCSATGAKFPASWTNGSKLLGSGCESNARSNGVYGCCCGSLQWVPVRWCLWVWSMGSVYGN
ncbi:hypothetical protein SESBI_19067 [Sesbania bispinosa]|nr:hypothetical protein SESBI_19067 [Sesbania bispinosa]